MAFADYDAYLAALSRNIVADWQMSAAISRVARPALVSQNFVPAPINPTTSIALDKNSDYSIGPIPDTASGKINILGARINTSGAAGMSLMWMDLLNISGGLNATLTTQQTTNLPTAALTRYTSGEGVWIALVIHTQIGTTATTITVSYTNQAGTSGRTTPVVTFGSTGYREARSFIILPLQAGDTGVRSVESVTLAATTGTAGAFGVALFKPVCAMTLENTSGAMPLDSVSSGGITASLAEMDDDACLTFAATQAVAQSVNGALLLGEA